MKTVKKAAKPSKGTVCAALARARTNRSTREEHEAAMERKL